MRGCCGKGGCLGDAKISQLWHMAGGHKNIGRLDVSVHDTLRMAVFQGGHDLSHERGGLGLHQELLRCNAFEEFPAAA